MTSCEDVIKEPAHDAFSLLEILVHVDAEALLPLSLILFSALISVSRYFKSNILVRAPSGGTNCQFSFGLLIDAISFHEVITEDSKLVWKIVRN